MCEAFTVAAYRAGVTRNMSEIQLNASDARKRSFIHLPTEIAKSSPRKLWVMSCIHVQKAESLGHISGCMEGKLLLQRFSI